MINPRVLVAIVNLLVLVVGLAFVELAFGNWFTPNKLNTLNLVRDVDLTTDVGYLYNNGGNKINYRRDRYGMRGFYRSLDKIDILTVGGSATDQRAITEGATWQDILRREFSNRGKTVNIANGGVDGQSTYGHIKNFDWWFPGLPNLKAKYFLFYIGANDFYKGPDSEYDNLFDVPDSTYLSIKRHIKERSALYYLFRTTRGILQAKASGLEHQKVDFRALEWVETPRATNHGELMSARLQSYSNRIRALNGKVAQSGGIPIYVTQPIRKYKRLNGKLVGVAQTRLYGGVEINGVDTYLMMQLLHKRTMEGCRDSGGICINLADEIEFDDDDFYDFLHNTPKGAEKIGRYLYDKLKYLFQ